MTRTDVTDVVRCLMFMHFPFSHGNNLNMSSLILLWSAKCELQRNGDYIECQLLLRVMIPFCEILLQLQINDQSGISQSDCVILMDASCNGCTDN